MRSSFARGPIAPRPAGFSLVELLVVIAVIVILLALLLPGIAMVRASARARQCASNEVQIWHAWTRANSRDPAHPVRGTQWTTRLKPYVEGGEGVFFCPDDTTKAQAASYAFNANAWRFGGKDDGRIVLLDYKQPEIKVVGQTVAQLDADWPVQLAARHFSKQNATFFDGHGDSYDPRKIDPRFCDYYVRYWRPLADSNIALVGCVNSGDPPPSISIPVSSTTAGSSAGAGTSTSGATTASSTTTAGGTTTAGTTTTTTTTTSTTTGTTTGTTTSGTTTGSTPCSSPGVGSVSGQLLALYKFDVDGAPGLDSGPNANDADMFDPSRHQVVDDPEPDPTKNRCKVMYCQGGGSIPFRIKSPLTSDSNGFTIMCWWRGNNSGGPQTFMGTSIGPTYKWNARFVAFGHADPLNMDINSGGASDKVQMASPGIVAGEWHHYAAALSIGPTVMYAWRDGVPTSKASAGAVVTLGQTYINAYNFPDGAPTSYYNNGLTGHFDNYRIYGRVLSDAEVQTIFNEEKRP